MTRRRKVRSGSSTAATTRTDAPRARAASARTAPSTRNESRTRGPSAGRAINDPFGGDLDAYRETLAELQGEIRRVFDRLTARPGQPAG